MPQLHPDDRRVQPDLSVAEAQLVAGLLKRRLAFVEGQRLLARRSLDGGVRSGSQRRKAVRQVETADEKLEVAQGAFDAVRTVLRDENMSYEAEDDDDTVGAF